MKYLVTGGAGFIGSHLVKQLVRENHHVIVLDTLIRGRLENLSPHHKDIEFHNTDITNAKSLEPILSKADGIFHQAALTDVRESFVKPHLYYQVNVEGTENIFSLAKKFKIKVVYASSSSVYGNPQKIPISEDSIREPINPYGDTKLQDEYLAERYHIEGLDVIGLRYFNVYGQYQNPSYAGVITKFISRLEQKKPPVIFGTGSQVRDFVFVEDVVKANIAAMNCTKSGFYNVGTGVATSINDLAKTVIELSGLQLAPIYEDALPGDVHASQADTTLAQKELGWKYHTNLRDGLGIFFS